MYNRIVLTLDGSNYSRRALSYAAAMARAFSVKLVLLQVIPYPDVLDAGVEEGRSTPSLVCRCLHDEVTAP